MKLYQRDYTQLTAEEYMEWQTLREKEIVRRVGETEIRQSKFHEYPKAVRHFDSLFPNNYLDAVELIKDKERLIEQLNQFRDTINSEEASERTILNFIKNHQVYFIIASILKKYYHFGHHDAFLFPEFQIGNSYQVDYLLVGRGSGGYSFVLVELEAPLGRITLKDGGLGDVFRKGIEQVKDWDSWLQARYSSIRETFDKYRRNSESLPDEFSTLDKSRLHFVVVAGRRNDFKEKTYRERRNMERDSILILHYDNLVDAAESIVGQSTY